MNKLDGSPLTMTGVAAERVTVRQVRYHGWPECLLLSNGLVEAVVVPAISRVMRFGLVEEKEEVFWQNRKLDGQLPTPASKEWFNPGGDKCWPAPQSDWSAQTSREWPPPAAFDALPAEAALVEQGVVLTSPVDPDYGIQIIRTILLDPVLPVMRITTEYRKFHGPEVTVGIWTITQLREPEAILLWLPETSSFPDGYLSLLAAEPAELSRRGRLLSLKRNPILFTKIGSDAGSVAWVGKRSILRIDANIDSGEYPDGGCVTEVYTNPDPLKYVELETMGALLKIGTGGQIRRTTVYTLLPRREQDTEFDAKMYPFESECVG